VALSGAWSQVTTERNYLAEAAVGERQPMGIAETDPQPGGHAGLGGVVPGGLGHGRRRVDRVTL
jgi:hypothetical protein